MPDKSLDSQLARLAQSAISTLAREMATANNSKDRQAAANSILDRVGLGRTTRVQADLADQEIRNALEAAAGTANQELKDADPLILEEKRD